MQILIVCWSLPRGRVSDYLLALDVMWGSCVCVCGGEWSDIGDRNGGKQAVRLLGESQMQIDASVPEAAAREAEARGEDVLDASAGEAAVQTESVPEAPVGEAEEGSRFEIKRHKPLFWRILHRIFETVSEFSEKE